MIWYKYDFGDYHGHMEFEDFRVALWSLAAFGVQRNFVENDVYVSLYRCGPWNLDTLAACTM